MQGLDTSWSEKDTLPVDVHTNTARIHVHSWKNIDTLNKNPVQAR